MRKTVDIANPHVLVDMDYFRPAAIHFEEYKKYTNLTPNPHPQSEYMQFWREEYRRCREGYIRESDGEWIPGYYYFYLNYSPIWLTEDTEDQQTNSDKRKAERVYKFPKVWDSDYLFYHYVDQAEKGGQHGVVLKTRGRGYSFKCGSMLCRNYYMYPGSRSYALAAGEEYLIRDGLLNKAWDVMDWVDTHTPWKKERQVKNDVMHRRASYYDPLTNVESGFKSEIIGVTLKNDPDKARGKRAKLILFEEAGMFPYLLKAWAVARPSVEQGRSVFGTMLAFGTGGTEGANFEGLDELFNSPDAYNIYKVKNTWTKTRQDHYCGYFVPEYMNREGFYDVNGNSNVEEALKEIEAERNIVKNSARELHALTRMKAEQPITPEEAVLRKGVNLFPVGDIKETLARLELDSKLLASSLKGFFKLNPESGEAEWVNDEVLPIRDFPLKEASSGCVEIFELPKEGKLHGRYIAGCDPYDDDESQTNSLGSVFVIDTFTRRIVAEYTGRPATAKEFYETTRRLLKFYNAQCNYENNKKGMFAYFENKNSLHLLADTPKSLKDVENIRFYAEGNKAKGTNASKEVNKYGRRLIADWMVEQAYEKPDDVINVYLVRSMALLKEAELWNIDDNFDRISSLGMAMILLQDREKHIDSLMKDKVKTKAADPFFSRMYNKSYLNG